MARVSLLYHTSRCSARLPVFWQQDMVNSTDFGFGGLDDVMVSRYTCEGRGLVMLLSRAPRPPPGSKLMPQTASSWSTACAGTRPKPSVSICSLQSVAAAGIAGTGMVCACILPQNSDSKAATRQITQRCKHSPAFFICQSKASCTHSQQPCCLDTIQAHCHTAANIWNTISPGCRNTVSQRLQDSTMSPRCRIALNK